MNEAVAPCGEYLSIIRIRPCKMSRNSTLVHDEALARKEQAGPHPQTVLDNLLPLR